MKLTLEEKDWITTAYNKGYTILQTRKILEKENIKEKKVEQYLEYLEELMENTKPEELPHDEEFKQSVKKYFTEEKKTLSWSEKRAVKKFLKNMNKYGKVIKVAIDMMKKEIISINERFTEKEKIKKEMEMLKKELITRILEAKIILDINDPITGEDATKENLQKNSVENLIALMELNLQDIEDVTNGRID